jgi:hypothetical protein
MVRQRVITGGMVAIIVGLSLIVVEYDRRLRRLRRNSRIALRTFHDQAKVGRFEG